MTTVNLQRLKLLALIAIFAAPLLVAWIMVEWRLGVPEQRTAHGELAPDIPVFQEWPLSGDPDLGMGGWVMAFDCTHQCEALADQWWRVHRALGREAPRVMRLRIGGSESALPGESVASWKLTPEWRRADHLWVVDPRGKVVLGYEAGVDPGDVLDDINKLLRMNPDDPAPASLSGTNATRDATIAL